MSKHTPGPWKITTAYQESSREIEIKSQYIMAIKANGYAICLPGSEKNPEAQANARLIAAAPEMYELLKRLDEACSYGDMEQSEVYKVAAEGKQIIQKITPMTNTQQGAESAGELYELVPVSVKPEKDGWYWVQHRLAFGLPMTALFRDDKWLQSGDEDPGYFESDVTHYLRPVPSASVEGKERESVVVSSNLLKICIGALDSFRDEYDPNDIKGDGVSEQCSSIIEDLRAALASSPAPAQVENPYPESVFPEPSDAEWSSLAKVLESKSFNMDKYFGAFGRKVWNNAMKSITNDNDKNS